MIDRKYLLIDGVAYEGESHEVYDTLEEALSHIPDKINPKYEWYSLYEITKELNFESMKLDKSKDSK